MRIKLDVEQIRVGMYIAALDRPWLESPFLFQGFLVETEDDLETLRKHCNYVFIDDVKSRDSDEVRRLIDAVGTTADATGKTDRQTAERVQQGSADSFRSNLRHATQSFRKSTDGVIRFFNDMRLGKSVETEDAKAIVSELVTTISSNVNTALWLTNLRTQHEATAAHCLNTSILALAFARHLGYPLEQLQEVGMGALLHDLGIARVPNAVLNKPGNLTEDEFEIVKKHPRDGYHVLKLTREIPAPALDIVLHHHERVNGSGYPDGLKDDEIREPVRIVAIADMYDSMTTERVYRKAMTPQDALTAMHKRAESDFGKRLMEEFIKCVGIYPIGSLVLLDTGALGVVVSSNPDARLKPLILLVRDEDGRNVFPRKLVNLATVSGQRSAQAWTVSRVVAPADYGIDIASIAAEEMRLN
ncbi:MAG TPA: HD-GYP domain-containing protein [Ferrovibrio sp.]|uniref:HD-GYP domain-containing protein n=1 Tax=Ferrovibrio sp. TaxID=1917215 RepID=UPI002ED225AD